MNEDGTEDLMEEATLEDQSVNWERIETSGADVSSDNRGESGDRLGLKTQRFSREERDEDWGSTVGEEELVDT